MTADAKGNLWFAETFIGQIGTLDAYRLLSNNSSPNTPTHHRAATRHQLQEGVSTSPTTVSPAWSEAA
jgi:hypothetical protein